MYQRAVAHLCRNSRAWRHGLQQPFYVPKELQHIQLELSEGRVTDATSALWKAATMGSDPAAATLGYMCLLCVELGGIDRQAAILLCREAAYRNNAYAQYVVAWTEYERGNYRELIKWINLSARQRFSPAMFDIGRLSIEGPLKSDSYVGTTSRWFRLALRAGHVITINFFLRYCKQGKFGFFLRIVGTITLPLSHVILSFFAWCNPFDIRIFAYPANQKRQLFQST